MSTFPCDYSSVSSDCGSKVNVFKFININNLFFEFSSFVKSFENDIVEFWYFLLTSWDSFLHCHKRLDDEWKLWFYFIDNSLNLLRQFLIILRLSCLIAFFSEWLFGPILLGWWLHFHLLLCGFEWWFWLGLGFCLCSFLCLNKRNCFGLFRFNISLP